MFHVASLDTLCSTSTSRIQGIRGVTDGRCLRLHLEGSVEGSGFGIWWCWFHWMSLTNSILLYFDFEGGKQKDAYLERLPIER
jgi:hypothetical protein